MNFNLDVDVKDEEKEDEELDPKVNHEEVVKEEVGIFMEGIHKDISQKWRISEDNNEKLVGNEEKQDEEN
jgi:hypothetical protein